MDRPASDSGGTSRGEVPSNKQESMRRAIDMLMEGRNMNRKAIVLAVIIAAMSTAGVAGSADNSASTSYFEGVWSGEWNFGQKE